MTQKITVALLILIGTSFLATANIISGKVTGKDGKGLSGVFVSAHDLDNRKGNKGTGLGNEWQ